MDRDYRQWAEEAKVIMINKDVRNRAKASYENSLIGKFIGKKPVNVRLMKEVFKGLWCPDEDLTVVEMKQTNTFVFRFPRRQVMNQVTEGGPWVFDDQLVLFKPWKINDKTEEIHFDEVILWFQILGLPFHLINDEVGTLVGSTIGVVMRVEARVEGEEKDRFIRVQAKVRADIGLPRRRKIETEEDGESVWVEFRYEGIPKVCTWCGCLNHGLEECGRRHTMPGGATTGNEKKMPAKDELAAKATAAESPLGSSREIPFSSIEKPPAVVPFSHGTYVKSSSKGCRDINMRDMISQQPDEILVQILSLLTFKEAGRSSVLSRRWKDLWKLTTSLIFECPNSLDRVFKYNSFKHGRECFSRDRSKFVTWVNQVLRLHQSPWLNKFRLVFALDGRYSDDIDQWINFIIPKRVKILEICLFRNIHYERHHYYYGFSEECVRAFRSASNLDSIKFLTSLSLSYVNVDGELIRYFVSNCPHLEKLYIAHSYLSSNLKVAGTSVQLKYLEIQVCNFNSIELSAPKLVTFRWTGAGLPDFHIGSNPLLSELNIQGGYSTPVTSRVLPQFSSVLPQLETLSLTLWFHLYNDQLQVIPQIPVLRNLKHLVLDIWISESVSLMKFTKLIVAAPFLVKFSLQLNSNDLVLDMGMETEPCSQPHQCLKEVEILGFLGNNCDFELAMFLAKNAIRLEKMVIDLDIIHNQERKTLEQVNVLKKMLSPGAKLILKAFEKP